MTDNIQPLLINRGTGAGGANTTLHGKKFEELTDNQPRLLKSNYTRFKLQKTSAKKYNYYLKREFVDKNVVFVLQHGFKTYMKNKYNVDVIRCPDEAYIIEYKSGRKVVKILEKREQHVNGSVETKLWGGLALKEEYEITLGPSFEIHYGYCVNNFLKDKFTDEKRFRILSVILNRNNIAVLFGNDNDYFEILDKWIIN